MLIFGVSDISASIKWVERDFLALSLLLQHKESFPNQHLQTPQILWNLRLTTYPVCTCKLFSFKLETKHTPAHILLGPPTTHKRKVKPHSTLSRFRQNCYFNCKSIRLFCIWFLKQDRCICHRIIYSSWSQTHFLMHRTG